MRRAGISGLVTRKRGRTTVRVPGVRVADDLVRRGFRPAGPNVLWVADITYLSTWEGRLYLAAVQDAFSRAIVGWSMESHMRAELVTDALGMGLSRRRPGEGLIHHSDQGAQYVSLAFGQQARDAGIAVSMGSKGDCFDNAVAESFFATLKKELVYREGPWPTRSALTSAIFEWIEVFYNRERRHSTPGYLRMVQILNLNGPEVKARLDQSLNVICSTNSDDTEHNGRRTQFRLPRGRSWLRDRSPGRRHLARPSNSAIEFSNNSLCQLPFTCRPTSQS
jgi:putative transposase